MLDEIKAQTSLLVQPQRHDFWQPRDDRPDAPRDLRTAYAPPLLALLCESLGSTTGGGRGGAEKRTRSIIDADGLELWETITETAQVLYHRETDSRLYRGSKDPRDLLKAWLPLFLKRMYREIRPDEDKKEQKQVLGTLTGWVRTIEDKFDPPRKIEILVECPVCGKRRYLDGLGDESSAMVAEVSSSGSVRIVCRSCKKVWPSLGQYQLEQGQGLPVSMEATIPLSNE